MVGGEADALALLVRSSDWIRWIPLLPLAAALLHALLLVFFRRPISRVLVAVISCGAPLAAFLVTCRLFFELVGQPAGERLLVDELFLWIGAGRFSAGLSFLFDPLAALLALVVTGVGTLVHIYAIGFMGEDERDDGGFHRVFCYLNLLTASMLCLVLAENLLVTVLGWGAVGACSYLLIGFWYGESTHAGHSTTAVLVYRVGDAGLLCAVGLLFWAMADLGEPSLRFAALESQIGALAERRVAVPEGWPGGPAWRFTTLVGLALFVAAAAQSAQIPLQIWLPGATAGPIPALAMVQATATAAAGVYLVCRLSFLFAEAPGASQGIAWVGGTTAFLASIAALAQSDLKKVLAFATMSQLGLVFLAAGCGAFTAAMFHLTTHAFFMALLVLAAGSVLLATRGEAAIGRMGGLAKRLPLTHAVFVVGVLAIAGIPPFSGFFSRGEVLRAAWSAAPVAGHPLLLGLGLATAFLTALFMFRVLARVFWGKPRGSREVFAAARERGASLSYPLVILATLSLVGFAIGFPEVWGDLFGIPKSNSLANFFEGVVAAAPHSASPEVELRLAAAALASSGLGLLVGYWLYVRWPRAAGHAAAALRTFHRFLDRRGALDSAYAALIARPLLVFSDRVLFRTLDARVIDAFAVHGVAELARASASRVLKYAHSGLAQSYLFAVVLGGIAVVAWLVVER